jgi:hypothetical protein
MCQGAETYSSLSLDTVLAPVDIPRSEPLSPTITVQSRSKRRCVPVVPMRPAQRLVIRFQRCTTAVTAVGVGGSLPGWPAVGRTLSTRLLLDQVLESLESGLSLCSAPRQQQQQQTHPHVSRSSAVLELDANYRQCA